MSDLPPLGVPRRPGSAPRQEVLDAVVRAGRRKLQRAALGGASAIALIAAGILGGGLLGGEGGSVVLVPATPEPDGGLPPTAAGTAPPALVSASPSPVVSGHAMSPAPDRVNSSGAPTAGASRAPEPTPSPRPGAKPYRESPGRTTNSTCHVEDAIAGTPNGTFVCAIATASRTSVPSGEFVDVELELCNSIASDKAYIAEFPTGREHDVSAEYGDDPVWTWSRAYTFPEDHHVRYIDPGWCLSWVTRWDTRDDERRLVEPGLYYLEASIEISEGARRFSIRVDVTEPTPSPSPSDL